MTSITFMKISSLALAIDKQASGIPSNERWIQDSVFNLTISATELVVLLEYVEVLDHQVCVSHRIITAEKDFTAVSIL